MLHPPTSLHTMNLHRPWHGRLWADAIGAVRALARHLAGALRERRKRRIEHEEWRAAVELDERILRDIGAPQWLQSQADSVRELRRFERDLMGLETRRELRHFR